MSSMPGLRGVRAVTQAVGRRTALRYLAVGVGSSLLAACGKGRDDGNGGSTGPVGQAVGAFVRGKWWVEATFGASDPSVFLVEVTSSTWVLAPDERHLQDSSRRGQWSLRGSKLTVRGRDSLNRAMHANALHVPEKVGETASLRLPWQVSTSDADDELRVKYAKDVLHLVLITNGSGPEYKFTCTRA